jgi:hypothetical protein
MVDATDIAGYQCKKCLSWVPRDEMFLRDDEAHNGICLACETENINFLGGDL